MMTMALVLLRSLNLFPLQLTNTNISEPDIISMILKDNVSRLPPVIKTWNMAPFFTLVPPLTHRKQTIHHMSAEFILHFPLSAQLNPVGEWNTGKIVFNRNRGEHWLNGKRVVEYELGTHMMNRLFAMSKWGDKSEEGSHIPGFNDRRESGYIVLQDHGDDVWFRNIRIREL